MVVTCVANPLLLYYSSKSSLWKVADSGLSIEGSSNTNRPSRYASGTQGYGAPELMESDGDPDRYSFSLVAQINGFESRIW
jgi:hypothetical protein